MQKRTQFTIQEIINDLRMTSTTTRHPVKAKSLTLLELCQTINELRSTSSRNTTQILTRRLYLHPLTISTNAKQHSSKIISNNLADIEQFNRTSLEKKNSLYKHKPYRGLSILSSSFPLTTRPNPKLNTSITTDNDSNTDFENSTTTISTNPVSLPSINRGASSSSKRTISTRSSFISNQQKSNSNSRTPREEIDVWRHLAHALQRPLPKDPPTTPLDTLSDFQLQNTPQPNYNSIKEIKIYKRTPLCDSTINENDPNEED